VRARAISSAASSSIVDAEDARERPDDQPEVGGV
jgi:hypothetical protein